MPVPTLTARACVLGLASLVVTALAATSPTPPAQAAPSVERIVVVSSNIHGVGDTDAKGRVIAHNPAPLRETQKAITASKAKVVLLQEVCQYQAKGLDGWLPSSWSVHFQPSHTDKTAACKDGGLYGDVIASAYPLSNITVKKLPGSGPTPQWHFFMTCADLRLPGHAPTAVRACTVHRPHNDKAGSAEAITKELGPYVANGATVILGGDFNQQPLTPEMDSFYHLQRNGTFGGKGVFHEATQNAGTKPARYVRGTTPNTHHTWAGFNQATKSTDKIDYLFFSRNNTAGHEVTGSVRDNPQSDHEVLVGSAIVRLRR